MGGTAPEEAGGGGRHLPGVQGLAAAPDGAHGRLQDGKGQPAEKPGGAERAAEQEALFRQD